jgi:tetratricopeptide (TPR) repeat protein
MNDTLIQDGARGLGVPAWLQQGFSSIGVRAFRIAGALVLIAGLQTWAFYNRFVPALDEANGYLDQLMNEVSTNTQMDVVLRELDNFRQVAGDDGLQKEVVVVYERFIKEFLESRLPALDQFEKAVNSFKIPAAPLGAESLARVKLNLEKVMQIYGDHYSTLAEDYNSPPLYLQPTAAFIKGNNPLGRKIRFNQAAYNSIVGDVEAANTTFNELKQEVDDPRFLAAIHFTQARMQYSAFKIEGKFDYFQQSIQNLQQSLRLNPDYGLAKMLLEYMLSVEGSSSTQESSVQGDGNGEAEGERGVISSEMPNF